jgi:excisionase family DNA binding protein
MIAKSPITNPLLRTIRESTEILRCSRSWLNEAIKRKEIRAIRLGRSVRIPESELSRLIESKLAASA